MALGLLQSSSQQPVPQQTKNSKQTGYVPLSVAPSAPTTYQPPLSLATSTQAAAEPELLGLLHTLPYTVTTFSACPAPVSFASAVGVHGDPNLAVGILAAVTAGGNVELVTLQQGLLHPCAPIVSLSLGMHRLDMLGSIQDALLGWLVVLGSQNGAWCTSVSKQAIQKQALTNGGVVMAIFEFVCCLVVQEDCCQNASRIDAIRTRDSDTVQGLTRIWSEECGGWGPLPAS